MTLDELEHNFKIFIEPTIKEAESNPEIFLKTQLL